MRSSSSRYSGCQEWPGQERCSIRLLHISQRYGDTKLATSPELPRYRAWSESSSVCSITQPAGFIAGCAVLASGDWVAGGDALAGGGLALIGAASAAAYLVVGRHLRTAAPLLPHLGAVNAIAAAALVTAALALGAPLAALPPHSYVACAGSAVVASFIGNSLLNAAVRTTPTHLVALAVLGEPVGSSLIT